ncbi:CRISPR-associated protein Cas5 [Pelotomaculum sp. FP]|uniref:type I-C CRISPR-associated protein Cas5c n=1 Tax=Pelotomaculum sp. FP TaxID=261474 RepID=UPI001064D8ED|nr:type I-C CRISPR-associated protein Cas5c [Pelotomaculum sp. FP]TEB12457.1 CRISPR-associated protein Cas5 [Pelotomaculum sp. FP]
MENKVEFKVHGKYALFTDPLTKIGGEKCSYQIPTYQAIKGIMESIYWKPTIIWVIDKVRVIKAIKTQTKSAKPINYSGGNSLSIYTYLSDVEYQVQAHFEWNLKRDDMAKDRNENKHFFVARRMIERGGRRDIFLGARECQGYVESCQFGEGNSHYEQYGELAFDLMFHGFDYPDESGKNELHARFWRPKMVNGIVEFIRPEDCIIRRFVKPMSSNIPRSVGLEEQELLDGYPGEVDAR